MDDFESAVLLDRWVTERTSTRVDRWRRGRAFFHSGFPKRYDSNFLEVERPLSGVSAAALAAEADRLLDGFGHRKVRILDDAEGASVAMGLAEIGWTGERTVVMVQRREPDRPSVDDIAAEVSVDEAWSHKVEVGRREPWGAEPGVAEMLADFERVLADAAGARFFAARASDDDAASIVSSCELYLHDGLAQVESVDTLTEHRGRGLARGCILRAIAAARAAGADHVFIWADAEDWPQHFYRRLGFDALGHVRSFLKVLPTT